MKFKPYGEYKKVNLSWIDEIPSHWEISRIKDSINYNTNGYWGEEPEGNKHDYICIRVADFDMKNYSVTKNKKLTKRNIRLDNNDRRFLEKGDLLIEKSGGGEKQPVGRVIQYNMKEKAVCSNFISKININKKNINSKYILFLLNNIWDTIHIMPYIKQTTGIQNLDDKSFFSNYIQIPPKEEQDKIADFLDHNLAKIDKFVELTERQIELLKEQKEVIINDAVTKGIDKNVEYKDSGIDWIGEIPEHWEVTRLKYLTNSNLTSLSNNQEKDKEIEYIDIGSVGFFKLKSEPVKMLFGQAPSRARRVVRKGDIIISTVRTYLKSMLYIDESLSGKIVSTGFSVLTPKGGVNSNYLKYSISGNYLIQNIIKNSVGVAYPAINDDRLMSLKIVYCRDKKEQEEIVNYIEEETTRIDRTIALYKRQIELIKEYRTSLIASAVTGKIDVRNF
ncbi:restriction endonuclease subunit S [Clostridium tetani]|uniref:restriction endonuclease subunit S n=1 Tax=Clostridium tetani TaxID=1513 RepID=UPI0003C0C6F8|nr:restriction endonuclease subunit S [Clostridium tetani]CDI50602.1 restriction endonuclease S subunit [Clostridium tetani 12124569]